MKIYKKDGRDIGLSIDSDFHDGLSPAHSGNYNSDGSIMETNRADQGNDRLKSLAPPLRLLWAFFLQGFRYGQTNECINCRLLRLLRCLETKRGPQNNSFRSTSCHIPRGREATHPHPSPTAPCFPIIRSLNGKNINVWNFPLQDPAASRNRYGNLSSYWSIPIGKFFLYRLDFDGSSRDCPVGDHQS